MEKTIDLGLSLPVDASLDWRSILDPERLLRLHPHWHVETAKVNDNRIRARLKDHATEKPFDLEYTLAFPGAHEFVITPADNPVTAIHFFPRDEKIHVRFTTALPLSAEEDQNLTLWLQSIRQYLRLYLATTPYTLFFRWVMNRALLKMNPSQRKICLMLYRFTLLEIVVILIILVGYFTLGR